MAVYKHYSFDLWMTLIKSNPSFKQERTRYFFENYNYTGKSFETIQQTFRNVDLMCNAINEKNGGNIHAEEMYLMVISMINDYTSPFREIDVQKLYEEMEQLVVKYMPVVYCGETHKVLQRIKETGKSTIGLLSNTGFIKGRTLRKVLDTLELAPYFDFQLYSDEIVLSKPNPLFFQMMKKAVDTLWHVEYETVAFSEIIHIGDNERADIVGATRVGMHGLLVNSNNKCISTILN
ncbi:HAD family hydrolase [Taibaiella soli]|uniref:HAD family hydrolase n=1 Tax=Taibaiella soli TaxID=1649169 RepID=A0A2W2A7L7_9BACT|nr:HAD family hydrolase [Taibaiella soli]PZF71241.1 HAD family hydrolase [Taibaiella soli]